MPPCHGDESRELDRHRRDLQGHEGQVEKQRRHDHEEGHQGRADQGADFDHPRPVTIDQHPRKAKVPHAEHEPKSQQARRGTQLGRGENGVLGGAGQDPRTPKVPCA